MHGYRIRFHRSWPAKEEREPPISWAAGGVLEESKFARLWYVNGAWNARLLVQGGVCARLLVCGGGVFSRAFSFCGMAGGLPRGVGGGASEEEEVSSPCARVRVALRVRPFVSKEVGSESSSCVTTVGHRVFVGTGPDQKGFGFDYVFDAGRSNASIYAESVFPLVDSTLKGYNGTVFAYGQTGSGKSFTMGTDCMGVEEGGSACVGTRDESVGLGDASVGVLPESVGIIPRAVDQIFRVLESVDASVEEWVLRVSYLEIYNEQVRDLLHPEESVKSVTIREDASGDIYVQGVGEELVGSRSSLLACLERGRLARTTASTLMNERSSRSHSLCTIMVQRTRSDSCVCSKLRLVDLAGSERAKKTGAAGERFKESVTINQGLLALGNVISALGDEHRVGGHVPYRESKLTRLLQDSLGGNSHTLMVACIGPALSNCDESLNTLRYANRARNIRNTPVINRAELDSSVDHLKAEISSLQSRLRRHESETGKYPVGATPLPLSASVLHALKSALPATDLHRVVETLLHLGPQSVSSLASSLLASPTLTPSKGPAEEEEEEEEAGLGKLRASISHWGRFEAARAQLLHRLAQSEVELGSEEAERFRRQLQRLAERGQLLQLLAQQQIDGLGSAEDFGLHKKKLEQTEAELALVRDELCEARADLLRDETIFTNKMREMRSLSRAHEALQSEHEKLCRVVQELQLVPAAAPERGGRGLVQEEDVPSPAHSASLRTPEKPSSVVGSMHARPSFQAPQRAADQDGGLHAPPQPRDSSSPATSAEFQVSPARAHVDELEALDDVLLGESPPNNFKQHPRGAACKGSPASSSKTGPGTQVRDSTRVPVQYDVLASAQKQLLRLDSPLDRVAASMDGLDEANAGLGKAGVEGEANAGVEEEEANAGVEQGEEANVSVEEEAKAAAEEEEEANFEQRQLALQSEATQLGQAVVLKEKLIQASLVDAASTCESHDGRLHQMSEEILALQSDLERTHEEMEQAEARAGRTASQMAEERRRFELRLRKTAAQLEDAQKRRRQLEAAQSDKEEAQHKLHTLQQEVTRMKERQLSLREQLKAERARHGGASAELAREISELRREAATRAQRVASLETENQRQKQQLQRRAEQIARLKKAPHSTSASPRAASQGEEAEEAGEEGKAQMRERGARFKEREAQVDEREAQVDEREAQVNEREAQVNEREAQVDEREARVQEREARVRKLEATVPGSEMHSKDSNEEAYNQVCEQLQAKTMQLDALRCELSLRSDSHVSQTTEASPQKGPDETQAEELERLGRENYFYKHSNRELKRRLRDACEKAERQRAAGEQSDDLSRANVELRQEIVNLRKYISEHPGATPVRVSKKALRAIADVE